MTQEEAIALIDEHKNKLLDPTEMLKWVHLRVIISNILSAHWSEAVYVSEEVLSK